MPHVVSAPADPFTLAGSRVVVHQIPDAHDNLIWVLEDPHTGTAAAVDGPSASGVQAFAEDRGLSLTTILNTHTHADHIGINRDYERRGQLHSMTVIGAASRAHDIPGLTRAVSEGDNVQFGDATLEVLETPGHLDGHICFTGHGALFCGDTMFAGGCGYLFDGPPSAMRHSLSKLAALPGSTRVCCAHEYTQDNLRFAWLVEPDSGPLADRIRDVWEIRARGGCTVPSTIELERATNPFLRWHVPTLRRHVCARMGIPEDASDEEVFAATRALKDRKDHREISDEMLPLRGPT